MRTRITRRDALITTLVAGAGFWGASDPGQISSFDQLTGKDGQFRMHTRSNWVWLLFVLAVPTLWAADDDVWPGKQWVTASPQEVGLNAAKLHEARDYALTGGGSGFITRAGKLVLAWGDVDKAYDLKSTTKSIGITALGLAIKDGKISLNDRASKHHPNFGVPPNGNKQTGWLDEITIQHLATQTAGFEKPGGYTKLTFKPGTKWAYSDGGPNWLAECVTLVYKRDVEELMFDRVFTPIGITRKDLRWRRHAYRDRKIDEIERREFGSGVHANVDAMARIGLMYLRGGRWRDEQVIPREFVDAARAPVKEVVGLPEVDPKRYGNASDHYGLLWWNNTDGTLPNVPRDAYWSWGLYESLIVVIPSLDIVVARAGKSWKREWAGHYDVLAPFFDPIVAAAENKQASASPYPPSPVIASIEWAPADTVIRQAKGCDNWPLTWAGDGHMYGAYGDGNGFKPFVKRKLSLGLARIEGEPSDFRGFNIRSETGEDIGDGRTGKKASGMLMADGVLYMLARNAGNSQLAWSTDRGRTWSWADWKFTESFGYPTFLNFGKNYANARDDFIYIYSHDSDSAYKRADRMVLARVHKTRIKEREAYEFLAGLVNDGQPIWTRDFDKRGSVFQHSGSCYRSSVSYNAPLKRYLWCQTGAGKQPRFEGGLAIYDAPEPWGPWTTVFQTDKWDIGPGETSSFPTKWMSEDGLTLHLVFSGDDHFSVRQAKLVHK